MTKRTKTTFGIAIFYSLFFLCGLAVMAYIITIQGAELDAAKESIATRTAKNAAYEHVMQLLNTSAKDRETLTTYFISEKDTIGFISELEAAANTIGVALNTTALSIVPAVTKDGATTPAVLSIGLHFKGGEQAVKRFIQLLENVPYHKSMPTFSVISDKTADVWEVTTGIVITMKP
jgi:hypothetical protein